MKISLITVTYNADKYLEQCFHSVAVQKNIRLEYIVIDGKSSDNTLNIINSNRELIHHFLSEDDAGMYDAINKGIALATGDIIGILNADDLLAYDTALSDIVNIFEKSDAEVVYGDLNYTDPNDLQKIIRKWRSKPYRPGLFQWGWMPPHPTFYARRELFQKYGNYRLDMGTAADYELMVRFLHTNQLKSVYLPKVLVKMRTGGMSNSSIVNRIKANRADIKAMKINGIGYPLLAAFLKPVRKIPQFFNMRRSRSNKILLLFKAVAFVLSP